MLYRFYGKDANRSSVPFLDLWSIHNESNGSWEKATTTLVDIYGEYVDNDDTIFIDDAQKGLGAALKKVMMNSATFICERHLAADVTLRFGSAGSQAFYLLARATRMDEFDFLYKELAGTQPKLKEFLDRKVPAQWSALHQSVCLHGNVASTVRLPLKAPLIVQKYNHVFFPLHVPTVVHHLFFGVPCFLDFRGHERC